LIGEAVGDTRGMKIRLAVLSLVALFAVALPAPASADDRSVFDAWTSRDADLNKTDKQWKRAFRQWKRSDFRVWKPLYRANKAYAKLGGQVEAAIKAQTASTPKGEETRTFALRGLRSFRQGFTLSARGVRLLARGKRRAASKALNRATKLEKQSNRNIERANEGFKALGLG
jgi:hypothetical protein